MCLDRFELHVLILARERLNRAVGPAGKIAENYFLEGLGIGNLF